MHKMINYKEIVHSLINDRISFQINVITIKETITNNTITVELFYKNKSVYLFRQSATVINENIINIIYYNLLIQSFYNNKILCA